MSFAVYLETFLAVFIIIIFLLPVFRRTECQKITQSVRDNAPGQFVGLSHGFTHYEMSGREDGPVIVFIHGFSVPYYMWDSNFYALADAGYRVVRYDLYGRGLSDRPDIMYNRRLFVEQLKELLDALAIERPVSIVGNSMGGAVAAAFTADYPERVEKVIFIDPLADKFLIGPYKTPFIGEYLATGFWLPTLPKAQLGDFYNPQNFSDWPKQFQDQMRYRGFGRALLSTLRNFLSEDPTPDYQKIVTEKKPVLLIWGAEDRTFGKACATRLQKILNPDFLWVEKAGHIPQYERPEIVNPRVSEFLSRQSIARTMVNL